MRPATALLACATVTALLLAGCSMPTVQGSNGDGKRPANVADFRILGDPKTSGLSAWPGVIRAPANSYDFDGDGTKEIFVNADDAKTYVFRADGRALAVLPMRLPPGWFANEILNGVEAGVLEPGAKPSIVVVGHASFVARWDYDPAKSTKDKFHFTKAWEKRTDECHKSPGNDAKPTLADLTGDGRLEIVVQTEEVGFYALRSDGSTLWKQCWAGGNGAPVVGDLNGDGKPEVVVASDSGFISVLSGATGQPQWTFDTRKHGITPASVPVSPAIGELDGEWPREVLYIARYAPREHEDPADYLQYHMAVFALRQDPQTYQVEVVWMRQPEWANPLSNTQLIVQDVDGDGRGDVFGMDWNTIGHRPGNWEVLGPAHVFRLDWRGNDVWVRELEAYWSNQAIALTDATGDGKLDVLANAPGPGGDGLWALDIENGRSKRFVHAPGWKLLRGPHLTDLHGDGKLYIAYPGQPEPDVPRGAIILFDMGVPYARDSMESAWQG